MYNTEIIKNLFDFIVKRQMIYHKRHVLNQEYPWTDDEILQTAKFCNIFRFRDKTTIHLINNLKKIDKNDKGNILFNTIISRIFNTPYYYDCMDLQDYNDFKAETFINAIENNYMVKDRPMFSSAYLVQNQVYNKNASHKIYIQYGYIFEDTAKYIKDLAEEIYIAPPERVVPLCQTVFAVGQFIAYQIALDLVLLNFWDDRINENSFSIVGPGSAPILEKICGLKQNFQHLKCLRLLQQEYQQKFLPESMKKLGEGLTWEEISDKNNCCYPWLSLADLEHGICEYRKYLKVFNGEGHPRTWYIKQKKKK